MTIPATNIEGSFVTREARGVGPIATHVPREDAGNQAIFTLVERARIVTFVSIVSIYTRPRGKVESVDAEISERFDLLGLAGEGGMGRVYRARVRASGELVALKLLPHGGGDRLRFAREAQVLSSLDHPAVVRYVEGGATRDGTPFIVMEWLDGVDLGLKLAKGPLDVESSLVLGRRLADALHAAHARGVVHRDLKPANVLLVGGEPSAAKVIDFGVARGPTSDALTASGTIVGTPSFMAPEQVRGERLDARTDVYGLGALLFCCLTGQPPFRGAHDIAVLARIVLEEAPRVRTLRPDVAEPLADLVARMLSKSMLDRPQSMEAVRNELENAARRASSVSSAEAVSIAERRVASFVLCNLRGRSEEQTLAVRAPARSHGATEDVVEPFGGTLHPLVQDAMIVTLRGTASPSEEATRASRCALAIAARHPTAPIAVVTGRVVVAGDLRVGDAIDRAAARVLGSHVGGVSIDEATLDLVGDRFEVRGDGKWRELVRERESTLAGRVVLGRPSPCVGRARELAQLEGSLAECIEEGRAQVALVTAPAGLGKSRLLQELLSTRVAPRAEIDLLFAQGDPVRTASSFGVASQLLARKAGILETDAADVRTSKLRALIARDFPANETRRPEEFLGEICGAYVSAAESSPELRAARADLATMTDVTREVWIAWLRARTEGGPVVVALEDLHWADLSSLRLIDAAVAALAERPLLVVATARPEVHEKFPDVFRRRVYQEVRLGALSARAAKTLVRDVLGAAATEPIVDALVERAAGHPFYLEELVRAVANGQRPDALPDSVLGMVQARLDDLSTGARHVLRAASVFGERFWSGGVEALAAGDDRIETPAHLRVLVEQEIVVRRPSSRVRNETEYAFRHALLRDAAYEMLTDDGRAVAHRLAGAWLEEVGEADPAVLAEHHFRGGNLARALPFLLQAARRALEGSDLDAAAAHAERANASAPDVPTRGAIAAVLAEVAFWRARLDEAVTRADEAIEALPAASSEWFSAASVAVSALGQSGRNDAVARWMDRIAAADDGAIDASARSARAVAFCRARTQLLWAHHPADETARARFDALAISDTLDPFAAGWVERVRAESAWVHERDVDRCLAAFVRSRTAFEEARATRNLALTAANEASLAAWSGDFDRAFEVLAAADADATRVGAGFLSSYALAVRGMAAVFAARDDGEATMRRALDPLRASPRLSFICRWFSGWCALERGDVDAAEEDARAACATRVVDDLACAGHALLSRVLVARGLHDEALRAALAGETLRAKCRDLDLLEGVTELALAEAHDAVGDRAAAKKVLAAAHDRLRRIARTIASPEHRARFWRRRAANDRIVALAHGWEIA